MKPLAFGTNYPPEAVQNRLLASEFAIPDSIILTRYELEKLKKEIASNAFSAGYMYAVDKTGAYKNEDDYISSIIKQ